MRRKLALLTIALVVGVSVALAVLPWWLGAALAAGGDRFGLTFGAYQRIGYTRFALSDVEVRHPGVLITASRIELATPLAWLAHRPGEVKVGRWSVVVTKTEKAPDPNRVQGWLPLRTQLDTILRTVELWLPPASAGAGEISWPGGTLRADGADWRERRLEVHGLGWREQSADVAIWRDGERLVAEARMAGDEAEVTLESIDAQVTARGNGWGQPLNVTARFSNTGWLPAEATAEATGWRLPAGRVGLEKFYDAVAGSTHVTWGAGRFSVNIQAEGQPLADAGTPPLSVRLEGSGDLDQVSINRLDIVMPGVGGRLNTPVVIGRDGRLRSDVSRFDLVVELAEQPWFAGSGKITGVVQVVPQDGAAPLVRATLATGGASAAGFRATTGTVEATLNWPRLSVSTAAVKLADGDELALSGEWDIRTRTLTAGRVQGRVSRATVSPWLTTDASFDTLDVDLTAAGAWPQLAHQGRAKATGVRLPPLRALALDVDWKGTGSTLDSVVINAVAGGTRVQARGAVGAESALIDEVVFNQADTERLRLAAPVRVQWEPAITVDAFSFKGPQSELAGRLTWGAAGEVKLDVKHFESAWLNELIALPGPGWSVATLTLDGGWDRGPLSFTAKGAGVLNLKQGRQAELALVARGDAEGLQVKSVQASMRARVVASASGNLPFVIHPGQAPALRIDEKAAFALNAATEPNAFFWEQVTALTGLVITDPNVRVALAGTLREPTGEVTLRVGKVASDGQGSWRALPEIVNLDARLTAGRGGVALETFTFKVAGQDVRATGRLPVKQWAALLKDPLSLAKADGEARIEIPNAEIAALAAYAPAYLAPTGNLQVDLAFAPGGQLRGVIRLKDAATRPLGPLGSLQSVGAEVVLDGRSADFKQVTATVGGQPVTLSGTVALPEGKEPRLNLALRGEKLPFVRQAGLLVRGDLDLKIVTGDDEVTRITGTTRLRDSLFLMDVRALLPSGGGRNAPERRPPYFAVKVPPVDAWQLDVAVEGNRFLRLRTPLFSGVASARFRLTGPLADPRAAGEAVIDQGQVILPFATFAVRQGEVRLTQANPFVPEVSLIGTSRRYGYELRMEVSGPADNPQLTFSSTPPLQSEQVLLMVMAGETPQNEVSYSGRQRAARLGAYLGRSLLGQLGGDPTAEDRLSVSVGDRISRQGRETYDIEYELSPRWSVVGEYDEFDEYNVGVKWRVLSEKRKQEEAADARK